MNSSAGYLQMQRSNSIRKDARHTADQLSDIDAYSESRSFQGGYARQSMQGGMMIGGNAAPPQQNNLLLNTTHHNNN